MDVVIPEIVSFIKFSNTENVSFGFYKPLSLYSYPLICREINFFLNNP